MLAVALAYLASFGALAFTGLTYRKVRVNTSNQKALVAAHEENENLRQTIAEIIDDDGNVRGQLALPGKVHTSEAVKQLRGAERREREAAIALEKAHAKIKAVTKAHKDISLHLAEVVDKGGKVLLQLRLPGEKIEVNVTPCGLCNHSFKIRPRTNSREVNIHCGVGEGLLVNRARNHLNFLDGTGNCVHFDRRSEGTVVSS
jgi:hypothetical protein